MFEQNCELHRMPNVDISLFWSLVRTTLKSKIFAVTHKFHVGYDIYCFDRIQDSRLGGMIQFEYPFSTRRDYAALFRTLWACQAGVA